jgi:hypothetical protein
MNEWMNEWMNATVTDGDCPPLPIRYKTTCYKRLSFPYISSCVRFRGYARIELQNGRCWISLKTIICCNGLVGHFAVHALATRQLRPQSNRLSFPSSTCMSPEQFCGVMWKITERPWLTCVTASTHAISPFKFRIKSYGDGGSTVKK